MAKKVPTSDRERLLAMSEEELDALSRASEEHSPLTPEELASARAVACGRVKVPTSIRLDEEILAYYRSTGPGYQTRMNNDLLQLVRERRTEESRGRKAYAQGVIVKTGPSGWQTETRGRGVEDGRGRTASAT